jgi:hypothetical protein
MEKITRLICHLFLVFFFNLTLSVKYVFECHFEYAISIWNWYIFKLQIKLPLLPTLFTLMYLL